jgi:hypothetical protein
MVGMFRGVICKLCPERERERRDRRCVWFDSVGEATKIVGERCFFAVSWMEVRFKEFLNSIPTPMLGAAVWS